MMYAALSDGSAGPVRMQLDDYHVLDGICTVPFSRWDSENELVVGKPEHLAPVRFGGFVNGNLDLWDMALFGIAQSETVQVDPQQRTLLNFAVSAMIHGG